MTPSRRQGPSPIDPPRVPIGGRASISFDLRSKARARQDLLVDVVVHFVKAHGKTSPKVFKLKRVPLEALGRVALKTQVSLAVHTTRVPRAGTHAVDVVKACFPAGTVSGSPKIRAMEIIEELEAHRRGLDAGAVGYFDLHGNADLCIAIRTLLFHAGRAHLGVGAGIVVDWQPSKEYQETLDKGRALLEALERAERGLEFVP